jgi:hypothetical protein
MIQYVDVNVPRFNQACVAVITGVAFVLQIWQLVAVVAFALALTRFAGPRFGVFTQAYLRFIKPRFATQKRTEAVGPPRFAQLLGIVFLVAATVLFIAGAPMFGWAVTLSVTALAALAATTRICVGCLIYEQVAR